MGLSKNALRVHTIFGSDGKLRTSYFEGDAAKVAMKNVKAFNKELARYERDFENYASLDIESAKIEDANTKYIFGKLNVAEKYLQYVPTGDMAQGLGDETTAIAGNKSAAKLGISAKIAGVFQPFFEEQAKKHPKLQGISDSITKAANGGRLPLTADSTAVMKIAFDKKYYNDCRRPGADKTALKEQYETAICNLMDMAEFDGVDMSTVSGKISEKLIQQMQIDESLTHIYAGMSNGQIRLGEDKPVLNSKGEEVKVGGKTLYKRANNFVDTKGNEIDCLTLSPREPQSIEDILSEYQEKLDKYAKSCKSEAMFRRLLSSDSYQNIENTARAFAEADCPDEAEKFKYELARVNIESCKKWAIENDNKSPYAQLVVPPKFDEMTKDDDFVQNYATSDYYNIDSVDDNTAVSDKSPTDEELAQSLRDGMTGAADGLADIAQMKAMFAQLKAENAELKKQLGLNSSISLDKPKPTEPVNDVNKSDDIKAPEIDDKSANTPAPVNSVNKAAESQISENTDDKSAGSDVSDENNASPGGSINVDKSARRKYLDDIARSWGSKGNAVMPSHLRIDNVSAETLMNTSETQSKSCEPSASDTRVVDDKSAAEPKQDVETKSESKTSEELPKPEQSNISKPEAETQSSNNSRYDSTAFSEDMDDFEDPADDEDFSL